MKITPGWRSAHVGFEDDGVVLRGIGVWRHEWQDEEERSITVAHPSYRQQRHSLSVYSISTETQYLKFAAGELSNGVWGFFLPD